MFAEAVIGVMVSSIKIAAGVGLLFFLYSLWRDLRNAFMR